MFSNLPRLPLAHLPTPLEAMPRLSEALGGPRLWIKRDDQTGLATLDKIAAAGTADGGQDGKPKDDVQIKSILLD